MLKPDVRGSQLKLDAERLREKERRDRAKLKLMVDLAYARTCRQQAILRYFGETDPARCGNCDICLETAGPSRAPDAAEALIVRKALSGVARMSTRGGEDWEPRFGRGRIVQTLVGSRSREIIQARLDQLSTYGLLKERRGGVFESAHARTPGRRNAGLERRTVSNGDADETRRRGDEGRHRLRIALAATQRVRLRGKALAAQIEGAGQVRWRSWFRSTPLFTSG